ncbi:Ribulose-bisphosphate carboxylase (fragment) [Candidatus Sulfopaludibacter sp. SbA3]
MSEQRIRARYLIHTAMRAEQAAEFIAGEQSTGTFTRVPGETAELRQRHGARVESVQENGDSASEVELSWPLSNMGPSLPNLLAAVSGNLWEMKQFSRLRLLDLQLPDAFLDRYGGPQFGVAGTRRLCNVSMCTAGR